jgi:uncharacterized protein DUF6675
MNMKLMYRFLCLSILFTTILIPGVFAGDLPFSDLSSSDLATLNRGEAVSKTLDSYKEIRLQPVDEESKKLLELMKKVKPNFLSEVLMVIPVEEGQDYLSAIQANLMDVEKFDSINTWSIRREKEFPLFEDTTIISVNSNNSEKSSVEAAHTMRPFRPHESIYEFLLKENTFLFTSTNSTVIKYNMFRAVKKGNMINILWIKDLGSTLFVYGAGGASVSPFFTLFGDRLDDSFTGRVEAFFSWFYETSIKDIMIQ